jgi:hypothetical protein
MIGVNAIPPLLIIGASVGAIIYSIVRAIH